MVWSCGRKLPLIMSLKFLDKILWAWKKMRLVTLALKFGTLISSGMLCDAAKRGRRHCLFTAFPPNFIKLIKCSAKKHLFLSKLAFAICYRGC